MMLLSGASATNPDLTGDYPLSALAISCDGQAAAAEIGEVLLQAGASVDVVESNGRKATPAMAAVMCPALLKVILAKKPNLNAVDALSCGNRNLVSRVVAYSLASRCTHPSIGMTKYSPRQEDRCIKRSTEQNP